MNSKGRFIAKLTILSVALGAIFNVAQAGQQTGTGNIPCLPGDTIYGDSNTCSTTNPASQPSVVFGSNNIMGGGGSGFTNPMNYGFGNDNTLNGGIALGGYNYVSNNGLAIGLGSKSGSSFGAISNGGISIFGGSTVTANQGEIYIGDGSSAFRGLTAPVTSPYANVGSIALTKNGIDLQSGGVRFTMIPTTIDSGSGLATSATMNLFQQSGTTLIQGVSNPVNGTDAANKQYVDSAVAGASGSALAVQYSDASKATVNLSNTQVKNAADATANNDLATWGQAKNYADTAVTNANTAMRSYVDTNLSTTLTSAQTYAANQANTAYLQSKNYTDTAIAGLNIPSGGITQAQLNAAVSGAITTSQNYTNTTAAATYNQSKNYTDSAIAGLSTSGGVSQGYVDAGDAATLASSKSYTDQKKIEAVNESKSYTDAKSAEALKSANDYSDQVGTNTLAAANKFTTDEISKLNLNGASTSYVDNAVANGVQQANNYTDQKFGEAKKYSYSAAALGMAASSLVFDPRLARQVAVGAATVNGQQAFALGVAWQVGNNAMVNIKGGYAGKMGGASVGFTKAF
ncbi:collagen-binding protein [Ralstonia solanacearum]|nr:collagen-binding protein [Ralstonia solanacearum]